MLLSEQTSEQGFNGLTSVFLSHKTHELIDKEGYSQFLLADSVSLTNDASAESNETEKEFQRRNLRRLEIVQLVLSMFAMGIITEFTSEFVGKVPHALPDEFPFIAQMYSELQKKGIPPEVLSSLIAVIPAICIIRLIQKKHKFDEFDQIMEDAIKAADLKLAKDINKKN